MRNTFETPVLNIPEVAALPVEAIVRNSRQIRVFFDLDFTLIINDRLEEYKFLANFTHLTRAEDANIGTTYFIFLEQTKQLFHWLLENNVKIGFATHSGRKKQDVYALLEKHYELPANTLMDAIYLDGAGLAKGIFSKIERLDDMADFLGIKNDVIFLVDDNKQQLKSEDELELKVHVIHAQGFYTKEALSKVKSVAPELITINDKYLREIRTKVEQHLIRENHEDSLPVVNNHTKSSPNNPASTNKSIINV